MKILIVEDSRVTRHIIMNGLKEMGEFEILESWDGTAALPLLKDNPDIGLILTDWNMPVMGGLEFVTELRKTMPKVPVVMITIENTKEDVMRAIRAGINGYISKPFSAETLKTKLKPFLDPSGASGE